MADVVTVASVSIVVVCGFYAAYVLLWVLPMDLVDWLSGKPEEEE